MNKRVLIIGGSGLLGKALLSVDEITEFSQVGFTSRKKRTSSKFCTFQLNILDLQQVKKVVQNYEVIINCSGQLTVPISDCLDQNIIGINNLITAVKGSQKKLIQISSGNVYGTVHHLTEKSPLNPENSYATAKSAADLLVLQSLKEKNYLIIRLSNLYGLGQQKGLISYLLHAIQNSSMVQFDDNNGSLTRFYLHADDAAAHILKLIQVNASGIYNLFGPDKFSIREIIELLSTKCNQSLTVKYAVQNPIGNIDQVDLSKLQTTIEITYQHSLTTYLQQQCKNLSEKSSHIKAS